MQPSSEVPLFQPAAGHTRGIHRESPLLDQIVMLRQGRRTILLTAFVVVGIVGLYTFLTKPIYESSSLVLIDMKSKDGASPVFDFTGTATASRITNELEILKSNVTAGAVARALLARQRADITRARTLTILKSDGSGVPGDPLATEGLAVERLQQKMEFTPIRESDIIRITARSTDPVEAAIIANAYTDAYVERSLMLSRIRTQAEREFLETQYQSKRRQLDSTESGLQAYMKTAGVVSLDAEANKLVEQLSQLEAQRDAMKVDIESHLKTLASYKDELAREEPNAAKVMGASDDSYIRLLQEQLAKLEVQRDIVKAQNAGAIEEKLYSDKVSEISAQIASLQKRLTERTTSYLNSMLPSGQSSDGESGSFLAQMKRKIIEQQIGLDGLRARVNALNAVIGGYEEKFNQVPRKSIELAKLQRARLSSEKLYLLIEEKYNEAGIKEKSDFGYVSVMDPAVPARRPVSPVILLNLAVGVILGLGLGTGIVLVRASGAFRIRTPEDLLRHGFLPLSTIGLMNAEAKEIKAAAAESTGDHSLSALLVTHYRPLEPAAESYRHLRTTLEHLQIDIPLRTIVLSSCSPGEGKTTTIANLAISFAQGDRSVLLVDADMRKPKLNTLFALENSPGLNDVLFGKVSVDEAIHKNVLPNLDIIFGGSVPRHQSELLGSKRMKEFVVQTRKRYEIILFDSPPLLAVTDAAILATQADGLVLVAASMVAQVEGLRRVSKYLADIGVRMLGVVLNKLDYRHAYGKYYASYHYGYYGTESDYGGEKKGVLSKRGIIEVLRRPIETRRRTSHHTAAQ